MVKELLSALWSFIQFLSNITGLSESGIILLFFVLILAIGFYQNYMDNRKDIYGIK